MKSLRTKTTATMESWLLLLLALLASAHKHPGMSTKSYVLPLILCRFAFSHGRCLDLKGKQPIPILFLQQSPGLVRSRFALLLPALIARGLLRVHRRDPGNRPFQGSRDGVCVTLQGRQSLFRTTAARKPKGWPAQLPMAGSPEESQVRPVASMKFPSFSNVVMDPSP